MSVEIELDTTRPVQIGPEVFQQGLCMGDGSRAQDVGELVVEQFELSVTQEDGAATNAWDLWVYTPPSANPPSHDEELWVLLEDGRVQTVRVDPATGAIVPQERQQR